jgi:hypothetical protein
MTGTHHKALLLGLALAACALPAGAARADGLPVLGIDVGSTGVPARTGLVRYVTLDAGRDTVVARVATHGGRVYGSTVVPGTFTVPAVAYDGSASGLSADGSRLVLIQPRVRFPRARTGLVVLDARRLRVDRLITLRGDYSFDAISPGGALLYLVRYLSANDPTRYEVRAFDVRAGRLLPRPVVDPRERDEAMRGSPITRTTSPDGRWAYTLYDGAGATPFVHALDTSRGEARCIDLQLLVGRTDLWNLRLAISGDGSSLVVRTGRRPLVLVDTSTFRVSRPALRATALRQGADGPARWAMLGALGLAAVAGVWGLSVAVRRRRRGVALTQP